MKSEARPLIRGDKSFMSIAVKFLFAQVYKHAQMSARTGFKRFRNRAVVAMLSEYKQINTGATPRNVVLDVYIQKISLTRIKGRLWRL